MASMRDIKRRRESVQSTGQITKAMKLVSTVKLQKAKGKAENTKPYFEHMYKAVNSMLRKSGNILHPYLQSGSSEKKGIIMVTSNRGLAGGYNSNIIKMVMNSGISKEDAVIYAVGRKGKDALARRGYTIAEDYSEVMNEPVFNDAMSIGRKVLDDFAEGKIGEIYLVYTEFKNTVTHVPTWLKLLPVVVSEEEEEDDADKLTAQIGEDALALLNDEIELLDGASAEFDLEEVQAGNLTPVFFGSALTNFGVEVFLKHFLEMTSSCQPFEREVNFAEKPVTLTMRSGYFSG